MTGDRRRTPGDVADDVGPHEAGMRDVDTLVKDGNTDASVASGRAMDRADCGRVARSEEIEPIGPRLA